MVCIPHKALAYTGPLLLGLWHGWCGHNCAGCIVVLCLLLYTDVRCLDHKTRVRTIKTGAQVF